MFIVAPGAEAMPAIRDAWLQRQRESWEGDPGASWEWLSAAVTQRPSAKVLILGTPQRPLALLRPVRWFGRFLWVPAGLRLDRFAPCPGTTSRELAEALGACRKNVFLPFVEEQVFSAARYQSKFATRPHGEFLAIQAQDPATYLETRPRKLRQTIRRSQEKLVAAGERASVLTLPQGETAAALREIAAAEAAGNRKAAIFSGRGSGFVRDAITRLDRSGAVETHVVRLDGSIAAYLIGFVGKTRLLLYTMAHRADAGSLSVGTLLFAHAIEANLAQGRSIDLGNGGTFFKRRFADTGGSLHDLFAGPRPVALALQRILSREHSA